MDPITLLVAVVVLILVIWLIQSFLPVEGRLKQAIIIVVVFVFLLYLLGVVR